MNFAIDLPRKRISVFNTRGQGTKNIYTELMVFWYSHPILQHFELPACINDERDAVMPAIGWEVSCW